MNLGKTGVGAFGVGTSISNAPTVNFALDIVEVEGRPAAKRGKLSCRKQVWRCKSCFIDVVLPFKNPVPRCQECNSEMVEMLKPIIINGKIVADIPRVVDIREYVLSQLEQLHPS